MKKTLLSFLYIILIVTLLGVIGSFYFLLRLNLLSANYLNDAKEMAIEEKEFRMEEFFETGSLIVSDIEDKIPTVASYGEKEVEILSFNLTADLTEDIKIQGIAVAFYSGIYGDRLDRFAIRNIYLIDDYGYIYSQPDGLSYFQETLSQDKSWPHRNTYAWFNGKSIIEKGTTKKFRLIADIPEDSSLTDIYAVLPDLKKLSGSTFEYVIPSHFKAVGLESKRKPNIIGGANKKTHLRPQNNIGSVLLDSDSSYNPVYHRISKEAVLSKIDIFAGKEEDILLSKIGLRITNLIPSQFKNIKLVTEDATQYGGIIRNPQERGTGPNIIFYGNQVIKAGERLRLNLIADVEIPSSKDSAFGTNLQREVVAFVLSPQNYSEWITARGLSSNRNVYSFGSVNTWLKFTE